MHSEHHHPETRAEFIPTPETEYLITDIEELVNLNAEKYLQDAPAFISVVGHQAYDSRGALPYGINRIRQALTMDNNTPRPELTGMDFTFSHPIEKSVGTPLEVRMNWSNDLSTFILADREKTLFMTHNRKNEEVLDAVFLDPEESLQILESTEVINKITGQSLEEVTERFTDTSELDQLIVRKIAGTAVDPATTLNLIHESITRNDTDGVQHTSEELRLEVNHAHELASSNNYDKRNLNVFSRRTMLRFERDQDDLGEATSEWKFKGSYRGKLVAGSEITQDTEFISDVAIPADKTLHKALFALSYPPDTL